MEEQETAIPAFGQYSEAVNWINGLIPNGIKPGLQRMELLMEKLNHPHRRLKFIHVGGTNGKGSTCAFLTQVLRQCGYDVGSFTSPYLEKFTNRIQYNGQDIEEETLLRLANRLKPVADEIAATELGSPSMFEICTALALLYFGTVTYPDYVVLEVGLGGRLDCTNIVAPVVSVITNIGHDHMDILGDTLEKVAMEKAGIIKPGVPLVTTVEQPEIIGLFKNEAKSKRATAYVLGEHFSYEPVSGGLGEQRLNFSGPFRKIENVPVSLDGAHQFKNAAAALMTLEVLRQYNALIVEEEDLYAAMSKTEWPGRLEMVSESPRILLDGAHNPEGAQTLAAALEDIYTYKKLHLMIGMLSTKNQPGYFRHILPMVDTLILTEPDFHKKESASRLAQRAQETLQELHVDRDIEIVVEPDWKLALEQLKQRTGQEDLAVVSGTLYMISDVRSWLLYTTDSEKGW
ncbi:bifunctional folylpolyglutamate synthase/dihydrofolate synthase [Paenibacillus lutrae]|uniref:Dihydrofolate synthase/folylpolyglutamate synthase n=1 Tax=Paenibacillus lutrae TaxID=2078573 RepID=A0A7X3JZ47_9BACL|nr:folylpolyglutamate synthase/dihydrofolate synthase family protein [Paenibacillus lutrae]MVO99692.1 bifunctional folylpolyglutamate synthase/dihydrofolate synthase [Paenibacillus lutrae]